MLNVFGFRERFYSVESANAHLALRFRLAQAPSRRRLTSTYHFPPLRMSKQDIINAIADAAGITKRAAASALDSLVKLITNELKKGKSVTITGFGTFKVSRRAARTGVNPRNPMQRISIPAMKVPAFKAGKTLKDAVR